MSRSGSHQIQRHKWWSGRGSGDKLHTPSGSSPRNSRYLGVSPGGVYIDCTVGEGGHSFAILEAATPGGRLLGIDLDPQALQLADTRLRPYDGSFILIKGSYVHLKELAAQSDFTQVDGILLDLGLSSLQLRGEGRGFSFQRNDPLDMRFDPDGPIDAADIVNTYPADELERILATYGEERRSRAHITSRAATTTHKDNTRAC